MVELEATSADMSIYWDVNLSGLESESSVLKTLVRKAYDDLALVHCVCGAKGRAFLHDWCMRCVTCLAHVHLLRMHGRTVLATVAYASLGIRRLCLC